VEAIVAGCLDIGSPVSTGHHLIPLFLLLDSTFQVVLAHFEPLTHSHEPFQSAVKRDETFVFDTMFVKFGVFGEMVYLAYRPDNDRILFIKAIAMLVHIQLEYRV
jgi:hypothetical protein